jgi:hypothetical protein
VQQSPPGHETSFLVSHGDQLPDDPRAVCKGRRAPRGAGSCRTCGFSRMMGQNDGSTRPARNLAQRAEKHIVCGVVVPGYPASRPRRPARTIASSDIAGSRLISVGRRAIAISRCVSADFCRRFRPMILVVVYSFAHPWARVARCAAGQPRKMRNVLAMASHRSRMRA